MKIRTVSISNFRAVKHAKIELARYTCMVGPNGAGKSTVLSALNVFFRSSNSATDTTKLSDEDFYDRNVSQPIKITITFDSLSDEAKEDLAAYVRGDELTVSAVARWDPVAQVAHVKQYGERLVMRDFSPFFEKLDSVGAKELRAVYDEIRKKYADLAETRSKDACERALREYETANSNKCELLQSEDEFYGFTGGANRLSKYIQWVYVPAVKDAAEEQAATRDTALSQLLARAVKSKINLAERIKQLRNAVLKDYAELVGGQQEALADISRTLSERVAMWAHPDARVRLRWEQESPKAIQIAEPQAILSAAEGRFEGSLVRFGHGLQRSYIIALLQELAVGDDSGAPLLVLGVEEPELYQHPPQARHLADVLQQLANGNAQIVLTTHSPLFVSGAEFQSVRLVRRSGGQHTEIANIDQSRLAGELQRVGVARSANENALIAKLQSVLQPALNEMFFADRLVLVEGLEDVAYIHTWLHVMQRWNEYRRRGLHIVAVGGKSEIIRPLAIANQLGLATYAVWDSDGDQREKHEAEHTRDNTALLRLAGGDVDVPFPDSPVVAKKYATWPLNIEAALRAAVDAEDPTAWDKAYGRASEQFGRARDLKKTSLHIGAKLVYLREAGFDLPVLSNLCDALLAF